MPNLYIKEPADPTGGTNEAVWMRNLKRWIRWGQITDVVGGTLRPKADGTNTLFIDQQGGGFSSGKMTFRGEYDSETSYAVQDVVVIRSGTNAGSYVCIAAGATDTDPPTQPDTGNTFWLSLSNASSAGTWL